MSRSDFASRLGLRLTSSHTNANGSCFFLLSEPDRELIDLVHPPRYAVWFGGSLLASLVSTHGLSLPCPIYPLDPSPTSTLPAIRKLSTTKSAQVFADVIKSSEVLHEVRPEKKLWITCKSFFFCSINSQLEIFGRAKRSIVPFPGGFYTVFYTSYVLYLTK